MIYNIFILVIGLILLLKGSDYLVTGSSRISRNFGVQPLIIGMTVVAFGTSLPEFLVSLQSAIAGEQGIGLGNIIGSNIANIALVLGVASLIKPLKIEKDVLKKDIPIIFLISVIAYIMMLDNEVGLIDGIILTVLFITFLYTMFLKAKKGKVQFEEIGKSSSPYINYIYSIGGIIGLAVGANLTIDGASAIASHFGISKLAIGLTIVAIGTSLPELVATLTAIKKGEDEIGIGNIVGSNIFNLLFVLGIISMIKPFEVKDINITLFAPLMIFAVVLLFFMGRNKEYIISRKSGSVLVVLYIAYTFISYLLG